MIYNIKNQNSTINLKANWDTKNSRDDLNIAFTPKSKIYPTCNNFFNNNGDSCDTRRLNDRFSAYGLIKSSKLDVISNKDTKLNVLNIFLIYYRNDKIRQSIYYKGFKN
jgi:hypothetical protein